MSFYDKIENVKTYMQMCEGYDPTELITLLKKYLEKGSTLLELGMGPGNDLDVLKNDFTVTGSDITEHFLTLYKEKSPTSDIMKLDAISLETNRRFDCIYSNKVLMHLTTEDLRKSIINQKNILNANGLICHTFWKGTSQEYMEGTLFQNYLEDDLLTLFHKEFELLYIESFKELEDDDSIVLIMKAK